MTFALLSVPLMGTVGSAIEYSRLSQVKSELQHALDAAALATGKELSKSGNTPALQTFARAYFDANLHPNIKPNDVVFGYNIFAGPNGGTRIKLTARHDHHVTMGNFLSVNEIAMELSATVAAGNRTVEVAIVIDNSGSMSTKSGSTNKSRLTLAKEAASELVNSLHQVAVFSNKPDPIKISVVPFAGSVNIGKHYRGASWLDMYGWSPVHHENIDWIGTDTRGDAWPNAIKTGAGYKSATTITRSVGPNPPEELSVGVADFNTTWLSRWTLFDAINVEWEGCVEMRPWPYHTNDATPNETETATLFVPMFAPDESDYYSTYGSEDKDYANNYLSDYRRPGPDYTFSNYTSGNYTRQLWRESWTRKYNADAKWSNNEVGQSGTYRDKLGNNRSGDFGKYGPNMGCTTDPLLPMTSDKTATLDAIDDMDYGGFTNVQAGLAWGWYTVSPGEPFTEGRSYMAPENDKYIIILTDGNNTYPEQSTWNETEYYSWGYGKDERVRENVPDWQSNVGAMNIHTASTCANIKAIQNVEGGPGIKIFTIAYDVPNGSSVKQLLYDCASTSATGYKYFFDVQGDAILAAMQAIGSEIADLRIAE